MITTRMWFREHLQSDMSYLYGEIGLDLLDYWWDMIVEYFTME